MTGGYGPLSTEGVYVRPNEFLKLVVPSDGFYIVATPFKIPNTTRTAWVNRVVKDIPEMLALRQQWLQEQKDVYFALASFAEDHVWNPTKVDYKTGKLGAKEYRTQGNAKSLKSLYLDLDVGTDKPEKKYPTQQLAVTELKRFIAELGLPLPLLVDSGYGVHVYWPSTHSIARDDWRLIAEKLKAAATAWGLKQDPTITADSARVLRLPGTTNFKHGTTKAVSIFFEDYETTSFNDLDVILSKYLVGKNVAVTAPAAPRLSGGAPALPAGVASNLGPTSDPANGNMMVWGCGQVAALVANRGATASGALWRAGLALVRFCDKPEMIDAISDGYPTYSKGETAAQVSRLNGGPTRCQTFWTENPSVCESCMHWQGTIKSPIEIARPIKVSPPAVATIPSPPLPYIRSPGKDGTVIVLREKGENDEMIDHLICQYDLYPKRILEQLGDDADADERSVWVAVLPRKGSYEFRMPQSMLSDPRKLHAFLLSRGLHIAPQYVKGLQNYMTAYLHELAKMADRERMFERLGWHNDHTAFVMPEHVYYRDGTVIPHVLNKPLQAITKNSIHTSGTKQGWVDALKFYDGPGNEPFRAFLYAEWGGILLHMTTHKGVLITASGDTGRGKTTLLEACYSVWGDPTGGLVGGGQYGATLNALWEVLGGHHSIPLHWDDTTERDPEEMRKFMLHISTGRGKERMHGNQHDGKVITWETFVLSSANTDDVQRIMSTGKDSDPHLMRFISIPFHGLPGDVNAKQRADAFKLAIRKNHGWGAVEYVPFVVRNYEKVQKLVEYHTERFDRLLNVTSEERHWSASLAVMYVGGRLAYTLGLSPFDPDDDEHWFLTHFQAMRKTYKQASSSSADIMSEFLDKHLNYTLVLSPKQASNVDNVIRRPHQGLYVRHEVDKDRIYVARHAWRTWCTEVRANQTKVENELLLAKVILRKDCHKVLAADTPDAATATRCIEIDRIALTNFKGRP